MPGVVALAVALTLLVSGLTESRSGLSVTTVVLLGGAGLALAAYAVIESRTAEPMVDLALLRTPGFLAATLGALVLGVGIIGMTSNVPTLVQVGLGGSLWTATWLVVSWSASSVVASLFVRRLRIRVSGPMLIAVAMAVVGAAQLLALGIDSTSSPWRLLPSLVVAGLATGVLNAVLGPRGRGLRAGRPGRHGQRLEQHRALPRCGQRDHRVLGGAESRGRGCRCGEAGRRLVDAVLVSSVLTLAGATLIWAIAAYSTQTAQKGHGCDEGILTVSAIHAPV